MNDYVSRRRSFKIFRITSAITMPPFSMKKIITLQGISFKETTLSYSVPTNSQTLNIDQNSSHPKLLPRIKLGKHRYIPNCWTNSKRYCLLILIRVCQNWHHFTKVSSSITYLSTLAAILNKWQALFAVFATHYQLHHHLNITLIFYKRLIRWGVTFSKN